MKEKRWKPEFGDAYYYVDNTCSVDIERYDGHTWDDERIAAGNCFNTKDAASAAAEKVKALLLSLHSEPVTDCNQLPKLTAEVFNRPDCPAWAEYAAVSKFGRLSFFGGKPVLGNNCFLPLGENHTTKLYRNEPGIWDASDWQNSLIERHAKLPDWCKVGEWVWINGRPDRLAYNGYGKITQVEPYIDVFMGTDGNAPNTTISLDGLSQARLRPYNAEEMRGLVGKVIERNSSAYLVYSFAHDDLATTVSIEGKYLSANTLLEDFTIDGKPCGVLEHLENGEWVK